MCNNKIILLSISLILSGFWLNSNASNTFQFLKFSNSARFIGMGGSYSSVNDEIDSILINPAGIYPIRRSEILFTRTEMMEDVTYDTFIYALPVKNNSFGFMVNRITSGDIEGRDINRQITSNFTSNNTVISVSYAGKLTETFRSGIALKYINSKISDESATSFAFDVGFQIKMPVKGLDIGLSSQNIGPKVKYIKDDENLPMNINFGISYRILNSFLVSVDVQRWLYDKENHISIGSEYSLFNVIYLRCGYNKDLSGENDLINTNIIRTGFGIRLKQMVSFDYAYIPSKETAQTHSISLGIRFK
jgi:hypothetical protein